MLFYLCFPVLDRMSTEFFYNSFYDFENCKLIYSAYSPYQKIEIIEDRDNGRKLYLNGLEYFNSSGLEDFNFYLSELPARLKKKSSILIVGSGSMSSVFRVSPFASQITTVEIDEKVYQAGKKYFEKYNRWREIKNWDVVIDDAKHYLANTSKKFDLIIVDIPAPYYIQTALLFTKEFYSMVRSKLKEEGIVSIYLCSQFSAEKKEFVSTRIVSAINNVFDHFFIINSGLAGNGFLIAGDNLRFDKEKIEEIVELYIKGDNFEVIEKSEVAKIIKDIKPASFYNLDIVLDLNIRALRNSTEFLP
ncbi:MAG: hypothetical protein ISS43_00595 [Candidatus Omnitrophica bacterium]|nr:hypothetical protein [Candidatus Omnitrophota bacterium]